MINEGLSFSKLIAKNANLILVALAILFGATTYASIQYKNAKDKSLIFTIGDWFFAFLIACFGGFLFGLGGIVLFKFEGLELVFAGAIGGFLGLTGLHKLSTIFWSIVGTVLKQKGYELPKSDNGEGKNDK